MTAETFLGIHRNKNIHKPEKEPRLATPSTSNSKRNVQSLLLRLPVTATPVTKTPITRIPRNPRRTPTMPTTRNISSKKKDEKKTLAKV
jgi:hypothetical protein